MKFGFVTCVQLGLSCIEKIYEIGGELDLLITLPDHKAKNKSGRIYLDDISQKHNIPLYKVNHINDEDCINIIKQYNLDWLFIIGWSQIAASEVLEAPTIGCIGMHPTLLPIGRGRAAIPWAIIKGLEKTGVSMFLMDEGVDTGKLLGQVEIPLSATTTASELYQKVDHAHIQLIENVFPQLEQETYELIVQDELKATYWEGRTPKDGEINAAMNMEEVDRLVRATTHPYPGAFYIENDQKIVVWEGILSESKMEGQLSFKLIDGYLIPVKYKVEYL